MSRRFLGRRTVLVAWGGVLVVLAAAPAGRACGPFFPSTILDRPDRAVLSAPLADFAREVGRLCPAARAAHKAVLSRGAPAADTPRVAQRQLTEALAAASLAPARRKALLASFARLRVLALAHAKAVARWKQESHWARRGGRAAPARPKAPAFVVPAGLPAEFDRYVRGALAYHQGDLAKAIASWRTVLTLPAAQRRMRSVWAAYMIGRAQVDLAPAQAAPWFEQTRKLARAGDPDPLGLAAASYGWQAKAALKQKQYARAVELYMAHHRTGDASAIESLRQTALALVRGTPSAHAAACGHEMTRRVVTAYLVARGGPEARLRRRNDPETDRAAVAWLKAIRAANVRDVAGADRLAWAAYQYGQMKLAGDWLAVARREAPIALWVGAKLALRAGKAEQAVALLAGAVRALPVHEDWPGVRAFEGDPAFHPHRRAAGELAALRLARGQYVDALGLLLRGRYWQDAAYVAEWVLMPEELIGYVDRHCPERPRPTTRGARSAGEDRTANEAHQPREGGGPDGPALPEKLRWLLARRLTRIGRWKQARPYYPAKLRGALDAYIGAIRAGHDRTRTPAQRAESFWQAALAARHKGMDLLATEFEPDGRVWGGSFEIRGALTAARRDPSTPAALAGVLADETARRKKHWITIPKRFHYRYVAASHAWNAAQLMPDQNDRTAHVLCQAGTWLKTRDPKAADRFYKALVRRCGRTDLGRQADDLRWFPSPSE